MDAGDSVVILYNFQLNCTTCEPYFVLDSCLAENIFENHRKSTLR